MAGGFDGFDDVPRSRKWLWWLLLYLVIFLAGGAVMAWALLRWQSFDSFVHDRFGRPLPAAVVTVVPAPPPALPPPPGAALAALGGQVSELTRRIEAIDQRARAASGDADRAEALLVAFAARRALDRGVGLGYIEALLRDRFGTSQPQAVATIISASRQPVTLSWLETELVRIGPALEGQAGSTDWWSALRRQLGDLIVVRHAGDPPTDTADRLDRAQRALESGQVDVALAEIARIPGSAVATDWIAGARRYIASRAALDRIETAALLEPSAAAHVAVPPVPAIAVAPPQKAAALPIK
jgi:hypothetical protein